MDLFKNSHVFAPTGPQEGPGLDTTQDLTVLPEQYTGTSDPSGYGEAGKSDIPKVKPFPRNKKKKRLSMIDKDNILKKLAARPRDPQNTQKEMWPLTPPLEGAEDQQYRFYMDAWFERDRKARGDSGSFPKYDTDRILWTDFMVLSERPAIAEEFGRRLYENGDDGMLQTWKSFYSKKKDPERVREQYVPEERGKSYADASEVMQELDGKWEQEFFWATDDIRMSLLTTILKVPTFVKVYFSILNQYTLKYTDIAEYFGGVYDRLSASANAADSQQTQEIFNAAQQAMSALNSIGAYKVLSDAKHPEYDQLLRDTQEMDAAFSAIEASPAASAQVAVLLQPILTNARRNIKHMDKLSNEADRILKENAKQMKFMNRVNSLTGTDAAIDYAVRVAFSRVAFLRKAAGPVRSKEEENSSINAAHLISQSITDSSVSVADMDKMFGKVITDDLGVARELFGQLSRIVSNKGIEQGYTDEQLQKANDIYRKYRDFLEIVLSSMLSKKEYSEIKSDYQGLAGPLAVDLSRFELDADTGALGTWEKKEINNLAISLMDSMAINCTKAVIGRAESTGNKEFADVFKEALKRMQATAERCSNDYYLLEKAVSAKNKEKTAEVLSRIIKSKYKVFIDAAYKYIESAGFNEVFEKAPAIAPGSTEPSVDDEKIEQERQRRHVRFEPLYEAIKQDDHKAVYEEYKALINGAEDKKIQAVNDILMASGYGSVIEELEANKRNFELAQQYKPKELTETEKHKKRLTHEFHEELEGPIMEGQQTKAGTVEFVTQFVDSIEKMSGSTVPEITSKMFKDVLLGLVSVDFQNIVAQGVLASTQTTMQPFLDFVNSLDSATSMLIMQQFNKIKLRLKNFIIVHRAATHSTSSTLHLGDYHALFVQLISYYGEKESPWNEDDVDMQLEFVKKMQDRFQGPEATAAMFSIYEDARKELIEIMQGIDASIKNRYKDAFQILHKSFSETRRGMLENMLEELYIFGDDHDEKVDKSGAGYKLNLRKNIRALRPAPVVEEVTMLSQLAAAMVLTAGEDRDQMVDLLQKTLDETKATTDSRPQTKEITEQRNKINKTQDMKIGMFIFSSPVAEPEAPEAVETPAAPAVQVGPDDSVQKIEAFINRLKTEASDEAISKDFSARVSAGLKEIADAIESDVNSAEAKVKELDNQVKPISEKLQAQIDDLGNLLKVTKTSSKSDSLDVTAAKPQGMDNSKKNNDPFDIVDSLEIVDKGRPLSQQDALRRAIIDNKITSAMEKDFPEALIIAKDLSILMQEAIKQLQVPFLTEETQKYVRDLSFAADQLNKIYEALSHRINKEVQVSGEIEKKYESLKVFVQRGKKRFDSVPDAFQGEVWTWAMRNDLNHKIVSVFEKLARLSGRGTPDGDRTYSLLKLIRQHMLEMSAVSRGRTHIKPDLKKVQQIKLSKDVLDMTIEEYLSKLNELMKDPKYSGAGATGDQLGSMSTPELKVLQSVAEGMGKLKVIVEQASELLPEYAIDILEEAVGMIKAYKEQVKVGKGGDPWTLYSWLQNLLDNIPDIATRSQLRRTLESWKLPPRHFTPLAKIKMALIRNAEEQAAKEEAVQIPDITAEMTEACDLIDKSLAAANDFLLAVEDFESNFDMILDVVERKYSSESSEGLTSLVPSTAKLDMLMKKIAESLNPSTVGSNGMYSYLDLSENTIGVREISGKQKIVINKDLKNLVTKRINEFIKGAHNCGAFVNVDMNGYISSGTVVAYMGNGNYKISCNGVDHTVPSDRIFKI